MQIQPLDPSTSSLASKVDAGPGMSLLGSGNPSLLDLYLGGAAGEGGCWFARGGRKRATLRDSVRASLWFVRVRTAVLRNR